MRLRHATDYATIALATIAGFGLGAIAMYVFDPVSGRRRRALARDKVVSAANDAVEAVETRARGLRNRTRGMLAETNGVLQQVRRGDNGE